MQDSNHASKVEPFCAKGRTFDYGYPVLAVGFLKKKCFIKLRFFKSKILSLLNRARFSPINQDSYQKCYLPAISLLSFCYLPATFLLSPRYLFTIQPKNVKSSKARHRLYTRGNLPFHNRRAKGSPFKTQNRVRFYEPK